MDYGVLDDDLDVISFVMLLDWCLLDIIWTAA